MTDLSDEQLKRIIEGALMAADHPLSIDELANIVDPNTPPPKETIKQAVNAITEEYAERAVELKKVASGYRFQVRQELAPYIQRLFSERPAKYSRALLETLALIVYQQPITRSEIEDIRGVAVSTTIIKTLLEREWIRIIGHKELPGKPALYATTKQFLDDFNVSSLSELPNLADIQNLDAFDAELAQQLQLPVAVSDVQITESAPLADEPSSEVEQLLGTVDA